MPEEQYQELMDLWTQWRDEHALARDLYVALYRIFNDFPLNVDEHDRVWLALANYEKAHGVHPRV